MKKVKLLIALLMAMMMMTIPVCAEGMAENGNARYNNISGADLALTFDSSRTAYITLTLDPYDFCSGVSGVMRLFDPDGTLIAAWPVSHYTRPIIVEFSHQCTSKGTYTATFGGHIYSNNGTNADRIDLSATGTCG